MSVPQCLHLKEILLHCPGDSGSDPRDITSRGGGEAVEQVTRAHVVPLTPQKATLFRFNSFCPPALKPLVIATVE